MERLERALAETGLTDAIPPPVNFKEEKPNLTSNFKNSKAKLFDAASQYDYFEIEPDVDSVYETGDTVSLATKATVGVDMRK